MIRPGASCCLKADSVHGGGLGQKAQPPEKQQGEILLVKNVVQETVPFLFVTIKRCNKK